MRLAAFIVNNIEPILVEWERFARSIGPAKELDTLALRDHAHDLLIAIAKDMGSGQTEAQRFKKSKGQSDTGQSVVVGVASEAHGLGRAASGFNLLEVVSEYRALRASVIKLWRQSEPPVNVHDLEDLGRFNEAIDQTMAIAVKAYADSVERSRQMFLAILGHDLRSPLHTIRLGAEALSGASGLDRESRAAVGHIKTNAAIMSQMVRDLIDFSSAAIGTQFPITPAPMDLAGLCEQAAKDAGRAAPGRPVRCTLQGDLRGEWDEPRLRQLLSNLVGNAVQHGDGPIEVIASGSNGEVLLEVHSGGPPIPPEVLATIFDPSARPPETRSHARRRAGSLGLGLYISRAIVTGHGGTIDIESTAKAGTIVRVRLPRRRAGPQPRA